MVVAKQNGQPGTVTTPAGLVIPEAVADQALADGAIAAAVSSDGRRRIVLTRADQKAMDRAIELLKAADLGIVVCCRRCNNPMVMEDLGTPDAGYGCPCSRVHFRGAVLVGAAGT